MAGISKSKRLTLEGNATNADCSGMEIEAIDAMPTTLRRLDVSSNTITNSDSRNLKGLENCVHLTWLDIKGNQLSSLRGLESLISLQVLNAGTNSITSITTVASLSSLKALILNNNSITALPDLSPLVSLNTLILSHNSLSSLPTPFPRLPNLKKISLSNNLLSDYPIFTVPPPPIQELRLAHNKIKRVPEKNPKNSSAATYTLSALKTLDIGSNLIDSLANLVKAFASKILAGPDSLVNLNLKGNDVVGGSGFGSGNDGDIVDGKKGDEVHNAANIAYKEAILPLCGSNLKVLDGIRFDAKFLERKEKRKESGWSAKGPTAGDEDVAVSNDGKVRVSVTTPAKKRETLAASSNSTTRFSLPANSVTIFGASSSSKELKRSTKNATTNFSSKQPENKSRLEKKDQLPPPHAKLAEIKAKSELPKLKDVENTTKKPPKRKAQDSIEHGKISKKAVSGKDEFFMGAFVPPPKENSAAATLLKSVAVATAVKVAIAKEEARKEKIVDKQEEKLRSGVVAVIEKKETVRKSSAIVKPLNIEELEKNLETGTASVGTGQASGWD
ncbi:hypothetical protein HK100_012357 [Physocladia obscura]|uniref:Uncharacterized protein n=1 Tax=Physocladia obscura TaxID=109957 RepID=A0AAD5XHN8_9FUNG|nr:hypothetical protein HK100_012357 [Physocladia obscura]